MKKKNYEMVDIIDFCIVDRPFTVSKEAPKDIIAAAHEINGEYIKINARPIFKFEDESQNDDHKLDFTKPIVIV